MNQMKYAVIKTLGNDEQVLKWFQSKDEAIDYGRDYFSSMRPGDGVLTVEGFRTDENGKITGAQRQMIIGWHF